MRISRTSLTYSDLLGNFDSEQYWTISGLSPTEGNTESKLLSWNMLCKIKLLINMKHYSVCQLFHILLSIHRVVFSSTIKRFQKSIFVFVDDIAIHKNTYYTHQQIIQQVLTCTARAELKIKSWKPKSSVQELQHMGHHINHGSRHMTDKYIEVISVFKTPATDKQLLKVLGLFKEFQ